MVLQLSRSEQRVDAFCQDPQGKEAGQSDEAHVFPIQDNNLTAGLPLRRSILQSTLRQKYRSTGKHNPQHDGGPEKGLYRLHPIALANACLYGIPEHEICYAMDRYVTAG